MKHMPLRSFVLLVALLALGLSSAGCGGNDEPERTIPAGVKGLRGDELEDFKAGRKLSPETRERLKNECKQIVENLKDEREREQALRECEK